MATPWDAWLGRDERIVTAPPYSPAQIAGAIPRRSPELPPEDGPTPLPPMTPPVVPPGVPPVSPTLPAWTAPWGTGTPNIQNEAGAPQWTPTSFGSPLPGYDLTSWFNPSHQTPKYVWGRTAAAAQATGDPNWFDKAIADFARAFPGVTSDKGGWLTVPWDNTTIDAVQDFGPGGRNIPQWMTPSAGGGTAGVTGGDGAMAGMSSWFGPNGEFVGTGNPQWDAILQGGLGLPGGGFSMGESQFGDPDTNALMNFLTQRVGQLTTPYTDPGLSAYLSSAQNYARGLQQPYVNPETATLQDTLRRALAKVSGEPFTDAESASLKAEAFDQLEQDRQAAIMRETARMASLGHGASSGTIVEAIDRINRAYDAARAAQTRNLTIYGLDRAAQNRQEAVDISGRLYSTEAQAKGVNEARAAQAVGALNQVVSSLASQRAEQESRLDKAASLLSIPIQLGDQRLQVALQMLGMGGAPNPSGIFNSLTQLAGMTQQGNFQQQQANSNFWLGMGQIISQLPWASMFPAKT